MSYRLGNQNRTSLPNNPSLLDSPVNREKWRLEEHEQEHFIQKGIICALLNYFPDP